VKGERPALLSGRTSHLAELVGRRLGGHAGLGAAGAVRAQHPGASCKADESVGLEAHRAGGTVGLQDMRWPQDFGCPRCDSSGRYVLGHVARKLFQRRGCRQQTSLTAGTLISFPTPLARARRSPSNFHVRHDLAIPNSGSLKVRTRPARRPWRSSDIWVPANARPG
jgi:hypothetical protein